MYTTQKSVYKDGNTLTEAVCLSTDTKPTDGIANGSICLEMDTGDVYMFDESGGEWIKLEDSGGGGGGGDAEVWFTGDTPTPGSSHTAFKLTDVGSGHAEELLANYNDYSVFLNGEEIDLVESDEGYAAWANSDLTKLFSVEDMGSEIMVQALYMTEDIPASVEVSVKAK